MPSTEQQALFKNGSTTYFTASLFFPPKIREYVTRLYAFVRKADDYVDAIPQQETEFYILRKRYETALDMLNKGKNDWQSGDFVVDDYIALANELNFAPEWTIAFLDAMQADLTKKTYSTIEETKVYMYGSAEVVGLFMCKLLGIPEIAYPAAQALGKSMQYINFIRDINEDISLGRQYLPTTEMQKYGLSELTEVAVRANEESFANFVRAQLTYYRTWQKEAEAGYKYIPRRYRIAIKTAADMYNWTATQIEKNPLIVFEKKVKPKKGFIIARALLNLITA